ncbi:hypothetical protein QJS04_geneDACA022900 [Acorus gramineus]|uniref:Uncharacterized protein n=1 Tax=Acorus gramineus TaxID=55184 RepID=A0AAV9AGH4_ACOGR|nr:hypothetical protein QJS04_geneDACA022900 [Acorus gramineus]
MEAGQSSRTKITGDDGDVWAKLVPSDSSYSEVEIRSHETGVCCEAASSSCEKSKWCKITRNPDLDSAIIINTSSGAIIIDEIAIEEEGSANIKSGSQIISGPTREGYLRVYLDDILIFEFGDGIIMLITDNGCFSGWVRTSKGKHKGYLAKIFCVQAF